MIRLSAAVALIMLTGSPALAADAVTFTGRANVVDGDTIDIGAQRIRIHGIDAPEANQTCTKGSKVERCGQQSTGAMRKLIAGKVVTCTGSEWDDRKRLIAICRVGGVDLGAQMVEQGQAVAFVKYSSDYVNQEAAARQRKAGMWATVFLMPWDYRAEQWAASVQKSDAKAAAKGECNIKGNINAKGERIYHVPGGAFYAKTQINQKAGERWFCSTKEAEAAGWRASER